MYFGSGIELELFFSTKIVLPVTLQCNWYSRNIVFMVGSFDKYIHYLANDILALFNPSN